MNHDALAATASQRARVDGKFFRLGSERFQIKGITYGPFAPNTAGEMFPSREQTSRDLVQIRELGANLLRLYYPPPGWFLDLAAEQGLKVLVDIPWAKHLCFLDSKQAQLDARNAVRAAVKSGGGHPAIFGFSVVNEISAEIVRWSGVSRTQRFIDELVDEARAIDPASLFTFTSFPPTEFLQSEAVDFACFNVYLHHRQPFEAYLARLQTLNGSRPLVLGEFGMDSIREGEARKCEFLTWQIESAFRAGLAGTIVFSFTDDWFRGGMQIEDWGFGVTTRDRQPKPSFKSVRSCYQLAPHFPLSKSPKVSVVVATYNGSRTLQACLESLVRLNYAHYEVIVVDDGSTDRTPEIARQFPSVRYLRQENQGLSAARNTGIRAASGEVVAFTDDDCCADEDWLYYLVNDLVRSDFVGIGGPNFLPPEDSRVAAAVMAAPGGPAHVLISDIEAEHIPGCNMAFYKWALEQIGMFDPIFKKAGDDVDICWRLEDAKLRIGFSPSALVWHYRRSTVKAYLKQQSGYGEAEALLMRKHPEHYSAFGGGVWRGRIYASSVTGLLLKRAVIYHGIFASGFFQRLYEPNPVPPFLFLTALGFHVFINFPLILLAFNFEPFAPLAIAGVGASLGTCALAAAQARIPRNKHSIWSRPLVALLFFLQPLVRGWARFKWRFSLGPRSPAEPALPPAGSLDEIPETITYWSDGSHDRFAFLHSIVRKIEAAGWRFRCDTGWTSYDIETQPRIWTRLRITTVSEELEGGKKTLRCRITGNWSLPAKLAGGAMALAMIGLIIFFASQVPWVWYGLVLLPLLSWAFEDSILDYQSQLAVALDGIASEFGLVKVPATSPASEMHQHKLPG